MEDLYLDVTVTDYGADGYLIGDVLMGDVLLGDVLLDAGFLGAGPESDDPPGNEYEMCIRDSFWTAWETRSR